MDARGLSVRMKVPIVRVRLARVEKVAPMPALVGYITGKSTVDRRISIHRCQELTGSPEMAVGVFREIDLWPNPAP